MEKMYKLRIHMIWVLTYNVLKICKGRNTFQCSMVRQKYEQDLKILNSYSIAPMGRGSHMQFKMKF